MVLERQQLCMIGRNWEEFIENWIEFERWVKFWFAGIKFNGVLQKLGYSEKRKREGIGCGGD